jgi:hypothetical protein
VAYLLLLLLQPLPSSNERVQKIFPIFVELNESVVQKPSRHGRRNVIKSLGSDLYFPGKIKSTNFNLRCATVTGQEEIPTYTPVVVDQVLDTVCTNEVNINNFTVKGNTM